MMRCGVQQQEFPVHHAHAAETTPRMEIPQVGAPSVPPAIGSSTVPWGIAGLAIALSWGWPVLADRLAVPCFLASVLILGMPHGASDLFLPSFCWPQVRASLRWAAFLLAYTALAAVAVALRQRFPWLFFWSFLALTAFHWGTGDFTSIRRHRAAWLACGLSRGALIVSCIVYFGASETADLLRFLSGTTIEILHGETVTLPLLICALITHPAALLWSGRRTALSAPACLFETALIAVLFASAPFYLALAVYFMAFHAQRHLGRILRITARRADLAGWLRAHGELTAAGVGIVLLGWCSLRHWGAAVHSGDDTVAAYVVLLGFLTLPHAVLVAWLDTRR